MSRLIVATLLGAMFFVVARADDGKKPEPKPDSARRLPAISPDVIVDSIVKRMDSNSDGKISRLEARNRIAQSFDAIDANKDGYLDRKELTTMANRLRQLPRPNRNGDFRPQDGFYGRPNPLDFDALDLNADGRLTRQELIGTRFARLFADIDRDKNGRIDPNEWNAYHKLKR